MTERSVVVRLRASIGEFKAGMDQAARSTKGVGTEAERSSKQATTAMGRMSQSARANKEEWTRAGTALTAFGVATTAAIGGSIKAAVDWESAWAGVIKTVDGSTEQLAALEGGLRDMARTMPATHGEIASVAEAAGQLGVATSDVASFSETMLQLGETTNLTADEAATSIAQMANVMGTSGDDIDRLGSALVALGNNGASTERDIIQMSQRISGAAAVVGMAESDVLAISNAVASMGIEVQAGGTSVSRVLTDMSKAAQTGSDELGIFAETAGISAEEFARAFREDPAEAFAMFIDGLGGIQVAGGDVFTTLDELGLADVRVSQALLGMASAGDLLTDSLDLGAQAWEDNMALSDEYAKRLETTAAQLDIAKNNVMDAAISFGDVFLPAIADAAGGVADFAGRVADLPEPLKILAGSLTGIAGGASLAAGSFLLLFPRMIDTLDAARKLGMELPNAERNLGRLGKAAGIAGLALAAEFAADAITDAIGAWARGATDAEALAEALADVGTEAQFAATQVDLFTRTSIFGTEEAIAGAEALDRFAESAQIAFGQGFFDRFDRLQGGGLEDFIAQTEGLDQTLAQLVKSGNAEQAAMLFEMFYEAAAGRGASLEDIAPAFEEYNTILGGTADHLKIGAAEMARLTVQSTEYGVSVNAAALATGQLQAGAEGSSPAVAEMADALSDADAAMEELLATYSDADASFIDLLGAYDSVIAKNQEVAQSTADGTKTAKDSWEDFYDGSTAAMADWIAELEAQQQAMIEWEANLLILSGRASQGVIDHLASLGPEGAPMVAQLVDASDKELARLEAVFGERSTNATAAFAAAMTSPEAANLMRVAGLQLGDEALVGLAEELASGELSIQEAIDEYNLAMDVNANMSPAEMELQRWVEVADGTEAFPGLGLITDPADSELAGWLYGADNSTGTVTIDGNDYPADVTLNELMGNIYSSSEKVTIGGNDYPADITLGSLLAQIRTSGADVPVGANTSQAYQDLANFAAAARRTSVEIGVYGQGRAANGALYEATRAVGGLDEYGTYHARQPMMAGPAYGKTNIRWAEPETGWEAYISGKPGMESRNVAILSEAARRLGYGIEKQYAAGGLHELASMRYVPPAQVVYTSPPAAAAAPSLPSHVTLVDESGALLARARVVAEDVYVGGSRKSGQVIGRGVR